MVLARGCRPPPVDALLLGVAVATFDNLSMKVDYSSYVHDGEGGYRLDMTNYFSVRIPRHLAERGFNAQQLCITLHTSLDLNLTCAALLSLSICSVSDVRMGVQSSRAFSGVTARLRCSAAHFISTILTS